MPETWAQPYERTNYWNEIIRLQKFLNEFTIRFQTWSGSFCSGWRICKEFRLFLFQNIYFLHSPLNVTLRPIHKRLSSNVSSQLPRSNQGTYLKKKKIFSNSFIGYNKLRKNFTSLAVNSKTALRLLNTSSRMNYSEANPPASFVPKSNKINLTSVITDNYFKTQLRELEGSLRWFWNQTEVSISDVSLYTSLIQLQKSMPIVIEIRSRCRWTNQFQIKLNYPKVR